MNACGGLVQAQKRCGLRRSCRCPPLLTNASRSRCARRRLGLSLRRGCRPPGCHPPVVVHPPAASVLARFSLPAWSVRGCSASELCSILPRRTCLRLILFCTCRPLCAGALWPMPAWVWRDVRSGFFCFFLLHRCTGGSSSRRSTRVMRRS